MQQQPTISNVQPTGIERGRYLPSIGVVIPCYKVKPKILDVLSRIGPEVARIYCVDDCCPENSGKFILENCNDPRIYVLRNETNMGVGGATLAGYRAALGEGVAVIVKVDGDGQMDPALITVIANPVISGEADYSKGNRFYSPEDLAQMPGIRLLGNALLSFFSKLSTGYWNIFDPTNGYTAIHRSALSQIPLDKISNDYFFESDMLFRLNTIRAVVRDVPMKAIYADEESGLKVHRIIAPFLRGHSANFWKRILYQYFIRDFSVASVELVLGGMLFCFASIFGILRWYESAATGIPATAGTVMLAAFPALAGLQMLLGFLNFDIQNVPQPPALWRSSAKGWR